MEPTSHLPGSISGLMEELEEDLGLINVATSPQNHNARHAGRRLGSIS